MNKDRAILIHDVASLSFLVPFSILCLADVFFGYVVYPMFITHALTAHITYDLVWILVQPRVIPSMRSFIILHHVMTFIYLLRPLLVPREAHLTSLAGLVEIDTSILMIRRFVPRNSPFYEHVDKLYCVSNLFIRVYYETFLTLLVYFLYSQTDLFTKMHMLGCQCFINVFSCGICALTFSKRNPALKEN